MTRYLTLGGIILLVFAGLYIALLRSDLKLSNTERDLYKTTLQGNIQYIANDTRRRQQNEIQIQGQLQAFNDDKSPDSHVGPLLGGLIDRMPSPEPSTTP